MRAWWRAAWWLLTHLPEAVEVIRTVRKDIGTAHAWVQALDQTVKRHTESTLHGQIELIRRVNEYRDSLKG